MRNIILGMSALALASVAAPALADDAAPPAALTISGSATVVTDYRFRGISQTSRRFAVQAGATVTHESGAYVSFWGSSIDDYVAFGSDQELDLIAGYSHQFGGLTLDGGVLYYYYPGSGGAYTDFVEPYASVKGTMGPVTAKVGVAYAPKQRALGIVHTRDDNTYVYGELSGGIPTTPVTVTAHLGETYGRSVLSAGLKNYTDWSIGASYAWKNLSFGVQYVDTDIKKSEFPSGRNAAKAGFVGSIGVAF